MPIVWDAETEAKLLAGLFKVCEIKVGSQQLKELAGLIGPDCTPKAVTHRLAKFKKMAGSFNGGKKGGDAAAADDADGENGGASPKKTKKSAKGGKASKKRAAEEDAEDEEAEDEAMKKPKLKASEDSG